MRDGQGCLLPVRHFDRHLLSYAEDTPCMLSWSSYKTCRAEAPPQFVDANPSRSAAAVEENPSELAPAWSSSSELADAWSGSSQLAESEANPCIFSEVDSRSANPSRSAEAESNPRKIAVADSDPAGDTEAEVEATFSSLSEAEEKPGQSEEADARFAEAEANPRRSADTEEHPNRSAETKGKPRRFAEAEKNPNKSQEAEANPIQFAKAEGLLRRFAVAEVSFSRSSVANPSIFLEAVAEGSKRLRTGCGNGIEREFVNACAETTTSAVKEAEGKTACHSNKDSNTDHQQPFLPGLDDETALRCLAFVPLSDLGRLAMVGRQYRDLVKSRLIFKLRRSYGVVEHWVFIYTSGPGGWTAYDASRNVWKSLPPANVNPAFDLFDRESLSAGTHLLWLGRETFEFVYYRYDLLTNSWEKGPAMVNPRCLFASASCGEFAFVAGGFGPAEGSEELGPLKLLNSAERYNSLSGQWEPLPPMSTPRQKCSGFFMDGKFYVIGGRDAHHQPIMSGEEYNPITGTWRTIENMYFAPEASRRDMFEPSPPLVAVVNNRLYAVENTTNTLKLYDKHTNTWRNLGYLPVPADLRNGWGVAFKALGDRLFVMGDVEGIAACCWRPGPDATVPEWQLLCHRERGTNSFLFNCAVMAC